jgi:hypothetical protein
VIGKKDFFFFIQISFSMHRHRCDVTLLLLSVLDSFFHDIYSLRTPYDDDKEKVRERGKERKKARKQSTGK